MRNLFRSKRQQLRRGRVALQCNVEPMEDRVLMTATPTGLPTLSYSAETSTAYGANKYIPVEAASHGSGSYGYLSWGFLEYGNTSAVFGSNAGVSSVNSVSLQLYNTQTSGNYAPYAGKFSVYVIPNDSLASSNVRFQSGTGATALGSTSGGASTLGITTPTSAWLVGSWTITSGLQSGYSTFTGSSTGSTATGTGASGTTDTMGASAAATIAADLNNGTAIRLAVVADDTSFAADWEGNYSSNQPMLSADVVQVPKIAFSSPTYTVNETDQNPSHTTPLTFSVTDTANPAGTTSIVDWTATSTNIPGFTTQHGTLTFTNNSSPQTGTVNFQNIVSSSNTGSVTITLSDDPSDTSNPVIPTTTATGTINYIQGTDVSLSTSAVSVDEAAGTVTLTVNRSGSTTGTTATTVNYTTIDGQPYQTNDPNAPNQLEGNAEAGRDYTAESGTLSWAAGDTTSRTITVPITDVATFGNVLNVASGTRYFTVLLSNPSTGTAILPIAQTTVTITDDTVAGSKIFTGSPSASTLPTGNYGSSGVETSGPYYNDQYAALVSTPHGSFGYSTMPVFTYDTASAAFPTSPATTNVDSLQLSIYNTATTGGYGGTAGSFDVYLLTDNSVPNTTLRYQGGTGNTGSSVIGTQATPVLLGSATFTNNYQGYNNFTFDLPTGSAAANAVNAAVHGGTEVRVAITPSAGSPVAADWEGNYFFNQPQLTLLTVPAAAALPAWVAPGSAATWNAGTKTLTVTGAATIIADPGTDSPNIVASGSAAQLTIQPATVGEVNLGGITLTNGASITVPSVGVGRTHTNHNVIVLDSNGTTVPTFSIDGTSKFDLVDNDLIIQNGASELSTIEGAANAARDVAAGGGNGGTWDGTNGLTSSAAAAAAASNGYEYTTLGIAVNGNLPNGSYATWPAGTSTLTLGANDVIVKYTYNGDFTLDGAVDDNAAGIGTLFYAPGTPGQDFSEGDMNGDGYVDDTDAGLFDLQYGLGTGGANGNAL